MSTQNNRFPKEPNPSRMTQRGDVISRLIAWLYGWACELLYHEFAWGYDVVSWLVSAGRWNAWRGAALDYAVGPSVLELGFGTGELLLQLAQRGHIVHGVDLSPQMHRVAQAKVERESLTVQLCRARAQALPYPDGSFQSIVSTFPAPYILDPETLRECARVLDRGVKSSHAENPALQNSQFKGRLIIVGMWVTPRHPGWLRHFPVFFGEPSEAAIEALAEPFRVAGLEPTFETFRDRWADVSVIVAERI